MESKDYPWIHTTQISPSTFQNNIRNRKKKKKILESFHWIISSAEYRVIDQSRPFLGWEHRSKDMRGTRSRRGVACNRIVSARARKLTAQYFRVNDNIDSRRRNRICRIDSKGRLIPPVRRRQTQVFLPFSFVDHPPPRSLRALARPPTGLCMRSRPISPDKHILLRSYLTQGRRNLGKFSERKKEKERERDKM